MKRPRRSSLHPFLRCHCIRAFHLIALMLSLFFEENSALAMTQSWITAIGAIPSANPSPILDHHAFPISESELRDLAKALAPKVDLFREVWEKDPEAEFFAGTTRDFLYWILGHFKGLENLDSSTNGTKQRDAMREKIEEIKAKLLDTPFIKFNEIVGPESDADIMTKNREALSSLRAEDFAIRKLDFISFDRALPGNPMYQDEINQGFIPSEKIRLSKKGISTDHNFRNGVSDLLTGNLSIHFPDIQKFWKTHYAKLGSNHPLLLALRYMRILSQDYLQRHGSEIPDAEKLEAPMTKEIKIKIQNLIQDAIADTDSSFKKLLQNEQGKKWLNASIQKSFRSFTNANAAFALMKELGILSLIEIYSDQIESVHQYLLKAKRDPQTIAENFRQFEVKPTDLYQDLSDYLPDLELYHGTASELAFRNLIYQGVIPSESGSAGRGLYGVSKKDLEFAKNWSKERSKQDDLVIALKLKSGTKIVDITNGKGNILFEKWTQTQAEKRNQISSPQKTTSHISINSLTQIPNLSIYDSFAEAFGIDLLRYPYGHTQAFVLKNSEVIEKRRGVFKNPRPLQELLTEAERAKARNNLSFLKDFLETPLTKDERNKIISILGDSYFKKALEPPHYESLKDLLNLQIVPLFEFLLNSTFTSLHSSFWNAVPTLLKDPNKDVRLNMTFALRNQSSWPSSFWNKVPALLKDPNESVRLNMTSALRNQSSWHSSFWNKVPALLKGPNESVRLNMTFALRNQSSWPSSFWNAVPSLMKDPNESVRSNMTFALRNQSSWHSSFWNAAPSLMKDPNESVRSNMTFALQEQSSWHSSFWNAVPSLMKDPNESVRSNMTFALPEQSSWPSPVWNEVPALLTDPYWEVRWQLTFALRTQSTWPSLVWNEVPALLNDPNEDVRIQMLQALETQSAWPRDIIDLVTQSNDRLFEDLKELQPTVLDLSSCGDSLSEIKDEPTQGHTSGGATP